MPTIRYNELSFGANYFQNFLSSATGNVANPIFDQALADSFRVSLDVIKKIHFRYNDSAMDVSKTRIISKIDLNETVSKYLTSHHHPVTPDNVASLYAVALSRYFFYHKWFNLLNHSIVPDDDSEITIDFTMSDDKVVIQLTQKEVQLGEFTDKHRFSSSTVFKAKQKIIMDLKAKQITSADDIAFSVSRALWDNGLLSAATEVLGKADTFSEDDLIVLTPFLINPEHMAIAQKTANPQELQILVKQQEFLNAYVQQYAKQSEKSQVAARNMIKSCFNADHTQKLLQTLKPYNYVAPAPTVIPIRTLSRNSITSGIIISDAKPDHPDGLSPEEDFNQEFELFMNFVKLENYKDSQMHYLQRLAAAITSLSASDRKHHYTLLAEVMRKTQVMVDAPDNIDNLNASLAIIEPLKRSNTHRVCLAFTAIVLGAVIVAASIAVTLASFGVFSTPAIFGITIGTGLLTKGIAIGAAVVGAAITATGLRLFTHRPYQSIIDNVENIDKVAQNYHAHQSRATP